MEVVHLNQKQLAARWHLSEACLERWRRDIWESRGRFTFFRFVARFFSHPIQIR
jgi:hypothetical protein